MQILVHMISETERHAGQADIVRENIDGAVGVRQEATNIPGQDTGLVAQLPREAGAGRP